MSIFYSSVSHLIVCGEGEADSEFLPVAPFVEFSEIAFKVEIIDLASDDFVGEPSGVADSAVGSASLAFDVGGFALAGG